MKVNSALIDVGGSSVKVTIQDNNSGKMLTHEIAVTPIVEGRHIYLNPDQLFTTVIEAMNKCADQLTSGVKINQIYISTLRQGFCLVSKADELTPIYLNSDTSGELAHGDIAKYGARRIYEETGHWFAPQLTLPKLVNLLRVRPDLQKQNAKLLFVHDWLVWKFTQETLSEMTLVSAGQMAKISERDIHFELLEFFGISADLMPKTQKFGTSVDTLKPAVSAMLSTQWSEAEVFVGGGDSHFLHMGASGNHTGKVVVSAGSSTPISLLSTTLGSSTLLQPWKSTSFEESMYLLEGNLGYPGSFFGWLSRNVLHPISSGAISIENISKAATVFGSCNMWNEEKWESRPAFSVLGDFSQSTSNDLALGLALDYSFALSNQISELINDGFEINQVVLTGGGANSQLQTILRSLLDVPVDLISTEGAMGNIFSQLSDQESGLIEFGTNPDFLDFETSEFLKFEAKRHALLYAEVEGTRKVLEDAI